MNQIKRIVKFNKTGMAKTMGPSVDRMSLE